MNYKNTSFKLACIADTLKGIEKKKAAYLAKMGELLSTDFLKTYSAEHRELERLKLNAAYLSDMVKDAADIEKSCTDLMAAFNQDTSAKKDTSENLRLCFSYLAVAGAGCDCRYIERLAEPLRAAEDIRSMRELHHLFDAHKGDFGHSEQLPFSDIIPACYAMDELERKLNLLCDSIKQQLPSADIQIDVVAAASPVLDHWGVANLIDYAGGIKAEIDGEEYTPVNGGAFNFNFKPVK